MATELSNYANDYRNRYRVVQNNSATIGWNRRVSDYNVRGLPSEANYGMYAAGELKNGNAQNSEPWRQGSVSNMTSFYTVGNAAEKYQGPFQGRYSLDFSMVETAELGDAVNFNVPRGNNPPANPTPGSLWFDTNNLQLMVYIDDGNSTQWVAAS